MNVDAIPAELRDRPQWVVWQYEQRDDEPTKCPYQVNGKRASSTDPATWTTFETVRALSPLISDGLGYVLADDDPYTGVDLDDCLNGERLHPDAAAIVAVLDSYTEVSPSGRGVKVIVRASLDGYPRHRQPRMSWGDEFAVWDRARFFCMTGELLHGTPAGIEPRQAELEQVLEFVFGKATPTPPPRPAQPIGLDDQALLELATGSRNGPAFERLWRGDTTGYASHSEADLALCGLLAFWAGGDPATIDRLFRSSGLYRDKWERDDYREKTIAKALEGRTEAYQRGVRPASDARRTHPASLAAGGAKGAGASRVPYVVGTQGRDAPTATAVVDDPEPQLQADAAEAFAAVDEDSAKPLLGDDDNAVLVAGGSAAYYGDGGAGKTTLGLDRACHLAAGVDWLGLPVPNPVRVLWIENEGPRGKFRRKVRAKLEAWDGPDLAGRLHVLSDPWARFTFADEGMRAELVAIVRDLETVVVIAGPVARLGAEGGGTPKEIQAFVDLLEQVRADLGRSLAYELIHHENKAGNVSGAWEGATDTLAHVQARGNGHTAVVWRKTRWAPDLHGKTWKLNWRDGERFELDETPETTDEDIAERLLALVREAPGGSWNSYDALLEGQAQRKRTIRDQLLENDRLVNNGTPKAMRLFLPGQDGPGALFDEAPAA